MYKNKILLNRIVTIIIDGRVNAQPNLTTILVRFNFYDVNYYNNIIYYKIAYYINIHACI